MRIVRKVGVAVMLGIVGLWASAAVAEPPPPDYARDGLYLATGALYAAEDINIGANADLPPFLKGNIGSSWGFDARAGYRFHPHFAWDAQFQYMNDFTSSVGGVDIQRIDAQALSLNLKANALTGRIQPYFLGGIGFLRLHGASVFNEFAGRIAGGIDGYINENVVLYAEAGYIMPNADLADFRLIPVSFGVQYRFGGRGDD
jgi:opacity protein-like surface antigen